MARGPGKYDAQASKARLTAKAELVALLVLGGDKGDGFAVQTLEPELLAKLPTALRRMADDIERDVRAKPAGGS